MIYPCVINDGENWSFKIKNLNNLENEKKDGDILIYEPFFLDDISLDFSKIPAIYISSNKLKLMDLQKRESCNFPKSMACPYAPVATMNDENDESKHEDESKSSDDDNDSNNNSFQRNKGVQPRPIETKRNIVDRAKKKKKAK